LLKVTMGMKVNLLELNLLKVQFKDQKYKDL